MERLFQDNVELGCYVDGLHGIHMWKRIFTIAKEYGFEYECTIPQIEALIGKEERGELTSDMSGQIAHDLENEIDDYLNEKMAVDKAYWGRNENGDWGVWSERMIGDYLDEPQPDHIYRLTGRPSEPSILRGDSWKDSVVSYPDLNSED